MNIPFSNSAELHIAQEIPHVFFTLTGKRKTTKLKKRMQKKKKKEKSHLSISHQIYKSCNQKGKKEKETN